MLDPIKSKKTLESIGQALYNARTNYTGKEGKKRSLGKKGISLRDLAAVSGVKYTQIQSIEKGRSNSTVLTLLAIAEVLDIDLCKLIKQR